MFDPAIQAIVQASLALQTDLILAPPSPSPPTSLSSSANGVSYQTLRVSLLPVQLLSMLLHSSEVVMAPMNTPDHQAEVSTKFSKAFNDMLTVGLTLAGVIEIGLLRL